MVQCESQAQILKESHSIKWWNFQNWVVQWNISLCSSIKLCWWPQFLKHLNSKCSFKENKYPSKSNCKQKVCQPFYKNSIQIYNIHSVFWSKISLGEISSISCCWWIWTQKTDHKNFDFRSSLPMMFQISTNLASKMFCDHIWYKHSYILHASCVLS